MEKLHTNLPYQLTSFVGREADLRALGDALAPGGEWRLVTLTGAGGYGKTRVALQVGHRLLPAFADGVWLVELAPLARADLIATEMLGVFRLAEQAQEPPARTLLNFLGDRRLLLIVDNCEHLLEGAAHLIEHLLAHCPHLRVLATSRSALGLPGEVRWHLHPLRTPAPQEGAAPAPAALMEYDAVRLFYERVRAARPAFDLSPENASAVAAICRRLDGMPLAIELVAPLVNSFTPQELAGQLAQRLHMRVAGHTALARHQTLAATADWSYQLLGAGEQALFRRLSIFTGGWSAAAAEAVCAPLPSGEPVAALLARLVDQSLVAVEEMGGVTRYRLLETLRDYAQERLRAAGEADALAEHHAYYFAQFAEDAAGGLRTRESPAWAQRLDVEFDNLRAAWEWLMGRNVAAAAALATSLMWYCVWRRRFAEGRRLLEHPLADPRLAASPRDHSRAMSALSTLLMHQLELRGALEWARRCLEMEERVTLLHEQDTAIVGARLAYAFAAAAFGADAECLAILDGAAARFRNEGDHWRLGWTLIGHSTAYRTLGDMERSIAACRGSIAAYRAVGELFGLSIPLYALGKSLFIVGRFEEARDAYLECRQVCRAVDNRTQLVLNTFRLAETYGALGQPAQALDSFRDGLALLQQAGERPNGDRLAALASVAADTGQWDTAALLFGASASAASPSTDATPEAYTRQIAAARAQLGDGEFERLHAEGRALGVADALALGLERLDAIVEQERAAERLPALAVSVLGPAQIRVDGALLPANRWTYRKARELLLLLACFGPRTRAQIGLALWPDASPAQLRNNLGVAVYHLRRTLGHQDSVVFDGERYAVNPALQWQVDLADFRRLLAQAGIGAAKAPPPLARAELVAVLHEAAALVRGELLEDVSDGEWFDELRRELHRLHVEVLVRAAQESAAAGSSEEAITLFQRALFIEPLDERAQRGLLSCLIDNGRPGQAIIHYRRLATLLRVEFGVEVDPSVQAICRRAQEMLNGDA